MTDPLNCGACDHVCPTALHAEPFCSAGTCALGCAPGFAACDGDPSGGGCTVDTNSDTANCGACGHVCPVDASGMSGCYAGKCGVACMPGVGDCDGDPSNGCESDLSSDAKNCGSCGTACNGSCIASACQCAGVSATAKRVPLDMYVMLDRSGSMNDAVNGGMTRWQIVTGALTQFFGSATAANNSVALQYFPQFGPAGTSCDSTYYYTPSVAMGLLPGTANAQLDALSASIAATSPAGGTPTNVALKSAVDYAADWKTAYPSHTVVVILSTDGEPGDGCSATIDNSAAAAAAGLGKGIPTYVIGVGSNLANLDQIASQGGTGSAFLVNDGNASAFIDALEQIKSKALACEYALPPPPAGGMLDPHKVNVQYTPGTGTADIVKNAADLSACDPTAGGWYYDSLLAPTKVTLCPATCTAVTNDSNATIDIILGCDTQKI
jgi:hypothetical protein